MRFAVLEKVFGTKKTVPRRYHLRDMRYALLQQRKDGSYVIVEQSSGESPYDLADKYDAYYNTSFDTKEQAEAKRDELNRASRARWTL